MNQEAENDVFAGTVPPAAAATPFDGMSKASAADPFQPVSVPQETIDVFSTDNPQGHGTSDSIAAKIPIGSFVLPANVVSQLGRGDTTSGLEALDRAFGKGRGAVTDSERRPKGRGAVTDSERRPKGLGAVTDSERAPMGAIESYLSRGEYVIPPDTVAAMGQGDPIKGADVLSRYFNVPVSPED